MNNLIPLIAVFILLLLMLAFAVVFASLFRLWLQCFLSGAPVPLLNILLMKMRRSPARLICEQRILARQVGVDVPVVEIERAYLQGADIEK